jgi:hypothetical protein
MLNEIIYKSNKRFLKNAGNQLLHLNVFFLIFKVSVLINVKSPLLVRNPVKCRKAVTIRQIIKMTKHFLRCGIEKTLK